MEINGLIVKLLMNRGITEENQILEFLSDKPKLTHDPALLDDIQEGTDLILSEIKKGTPTLVYGDYDADGITSTVLMMTVLKSISDKFGSCRIDYRIPSRFDEGYGLNKEAIRQIYEAGFGLIITVDCGSVSYEEVEYAKELGLKVVVTDHHTITDKMADCFLINPKRPGSRYPFSELSGCGVAYKVAQMLQRKAELPKSVITEVLDLVAIGTIGDIMPLVDENRTLVKYGLRIINLGGRPGLKKLISGAGLKIGQVTSENVGFVIVPHLNASGRIEDASVSVRLLGAGIVENYDEAKLDEIVDDLLFKNQERKRLQKETYDKCIKLLEYPQQLGSEKDASKYEECLENFILLRCDEAHEGIAGIVAGKLKEAFYRPSVLVLPTGEGELKGTGRSIEGVNLYNLLKKYEDLFLKFGGHAGACGFTMKEENFEILKAGINRDMDELAAENPDIFVKNLPVDLDLDFEEITPEFAEQINMLAPFGNKNPKPLFRLTSVEIRDVKHMGNELQHVRFNAADLEERKIGCVFFNKAHAYEEIIQPGQEVDIFGNIDIQEWQGKKRIQFIVEDITYSV